MALLAGCAKKEEPPPQPPADPSGRAPGLYMTFETSLGAIPCKLFEKEAPNTVRTIVGLALGTKPWLDPKTGKKVEGKRFYDGLMFHRVIPGFMIQGGDPLGNGMGGPDGPKGFEKQAAELGYPFDDEIVSKLRFDDAGRLAMANAGPRTNGSQFFITDAATPHLNGRHTIFGDCTGLSVVRKIAAVERGANDKPRKPVVIERVVVERVGPKPRNAPEG